MEVLALPGIELLVRPRRLLRRFDWHSKRTPDSAIGIRPGTLELYRVPNHFQDISKIDSRATSTADEEPVVEVGDQVLVMFNDEPGRQHTIVVSADKTDEIMGIYSANHSLGKAMLGAIVEDQISFVLAEKVRTATILGIEKPS